MSGYDWVMLVLIVIGVVMLQCSIEVMLCMVVDSGSCIICCICGTWIKFCTDWLMWLLLCTPVMSEYVSRSLGWERPQRPACAFG